MVFKGNGLIFNPKAGKVFANFNKDTEYETNDEEEIRLLKLAGCKATEKQMAQVEKEHTKKELIAIAKDAGIKGADRMSKEDILAALRGE